MPQDFAEWLEGVLRQRGMSQKALAEMIDVTPAAVNGWVNGRSVPRYEKITLIAAALEVAVEDAVDLRTPGTSSSELEWMFREAPKDGGREGGNAAAFAFAANLEVLAREATQNSLDERLEGGPVVSRFVLHELTGQHLRDFLRALRWDEIEKHLQAAADPSQKVGRVLLDGLHELERTQRLVLLRVDDYNATGLTGPEYEDGRFSRVIRRTLDSGKADTQGGSYGLGKAALWAASRFGLVLVNSTLSQPQNGRWERRMAGRLELPWHAIGTQEFAGPAWFGALDHERENAARSWWGDPETARSLHLERDGSEPGTSFLVIGAYDGSGDAEQLEEMHELLVRGIACNFWASMVGGERSEPLLRASVASWRNGRTVIAEQSIDPHRHEPARSRAVKAFLDGRTVSEITGRDDVLETAVTLKLPREKGTSPADRAAPGTHDAVLLVTPAGDTEVKPDRISYMRATRMVVKSKRIGDLPLGHRSFQAVLLAGAAAGKDSLDTEAAERLLRTAEPPDHNDWVGTEDLTATYVRGAQQRILDFKRDAEQRVREVLRGQEAEQNEDEGPDILKELLRLDPPKAARTQGFPVVHAVEGWLDDQSAWHVRVTVKYPEREDPWVLAPVVRFAGRDGGGTPVRWAELVPEQNCELTKHGNLLFRRGRRGTFSGVTDVSDHPVPAAMSRIEVDVPRAKEAAQ
ncbi:helix-turn-helix transcriptional regulator [Streptomyces lydicus]|uniref:helix-turn-helix transcriptional regulator n=1 Tax=Streptomyces lydicus TaxID=47763 RepID=UPI001F5096FB|nr:helix-turn-helix transcriptional regulator [Streptomyces lydicus]MCZ1009089.1 helix-turn-helix transcriptional regulator [Streptomyces lydicus]